MTLIAFLLTTLAVGHSACPAEPLAVISFNVRYDNPADGPDAWPYRREAVAGFLNFHGADIIGLQEPLHHQLVELDELLPGHTWFGAGRDDGRTTGEHAAIFFRTDRFRLVDGGTFWLSETPNRPGSRSWDAALPRILTWIRLEDRANEQEFFVLNTHYDHRGQQARVESSRLVRRFIDERTDGLPVILTGDLNALPDDEVVLLLTRGERPLRDALYFSETPHYGPLGTWNGFREVEQGRRIDYILTTPNFAVRRHAILTDRTNGRFLSDHLPVFAEVRFAHADCL
jgi:endonuclease/exonuclease/phosphatase family metal-dependent hydrolase